MKVVDFINNFRIETSANKEVENNVVNIIEDVKENKDQALKRYTKVFDGYDLDELKVDEKALKDSFDSLSSEEQDALITIKERIVAYQESIKYQDKKDQEFSYIYRPIERIGIYIPGGTALYPSSVLMTAVPASVAGVKDIAVVTPTFIDNNITFAALYVAGVKEVYRIGGAQAIAALTYGTETIKPVDKIVGPGNQYVAEAKKRVFGDVGIDMIAGPSEILLYIDEHVNYSAVAYDIFAQAEHDVNARTFLLCEKEDVRQKVQAEIDRLIDKQERRQVIEESLKNNHWQLVDNRENLLKVIDYLAPEHVSIQHDQQEEIARSISYAGAIFIGNYSPEAIGDYAAGPSHVLPTNRTVRFSHGLNVNDFLTSHALINLSSETYQEIAGHAELISRKEGLGAHGDSINIRRVSK